jgi:peptide/nickel transport system substrate-binding protein
MKYLSEIFYRLIFVRRKSMKNKLHLPFYLLVLVSLVLSACASTTATPAPAQTQAPAAATDAPTAVAEEKPLVVLMDNDEGPITPANFNTFIGGWMIGWVYDALYIQTPDLQPIPDLATSAVSSDDGLTWTITLREGVKWHDGEPFTVKDVIFSYDFLKKAGRANNLAAVESMEANGDYGLTLHLSEPQPFFLSEGLAATYILPEHIWKDQTPVSGELSQFQGMIGTGAYKLTKVEPGQFYEFDANPDYYRGAPLVPKIIAKIVKDRTQQFNQLRSSEADAVLSSVPPALVADLQSDSNIALAQGSDFFNYIFYTNGSRKPFDNPLVRHAIADAIDTKTLVDVVLLGQGVQLGLNWYHPDLAWSVNIPHVFDPVAAGKELDAAGLKDTDGDGVREFNGKKTDFAILCDVNNPIEVRATELIAGWLNDVGLGSHQNCQDIDSSVAQIWPDFVAVAKPDYDMAIWGWSAVPQARRGFVRFLTSCDFGVTGWGNLTGICDKPLDKLLDEFVSNINPTRTEELAVLIQERIAENLPFIPLMSPGGNFAYRPGAYDGWVYMRGTGIVPVWSFLPKEAQQNIP